MEMETQNLKGWFVCFYNVVWSEVRHASCLSNSD